MAGNSKYPGRSVISKISAILVEIAEGSGLTLTEIAARTDLPLSTVHRLATDLAAWCVLERDEDGGYHLGPPLRATSGTCLGSSNVPGLTVQTLRDAAVPVMEDLFRATGLPVRVGLLDGASVAYVEKSSAHVPVSRAAVAARLPPHATALGKALLAFSPARTVDAILARGLRQYTTRTVVRPERLRWAFRTIRMSRIAVCDRELHQDCCGVATPVFGAGGQVVAAVELGVLDLSQDVPALRAPLAVAAGSLSREVTRHQICDRAASRAPCSASRAVPRPGGTADLLPLLPTAVAQS